MYNIGLWPSKSTRVRRPLEIVLGTKSAAIIQVWQKWVIKWTSRLAWIYVSKSIILGHAVLP